MTGAPWPNALKRGAAVLDKLSDGFRARMARQITAGELEFIIAECGDATGAIERDERLAWNMACQTRLAVREGRAS